ncbi:MAG: hypothetical protein ACHQNA_09100 [Acidimicrobiales bacterium]
MANDKRKTGRVTPKKGTPPPARARAKRPSILPKRVGPFERPDADRSLGQVGRRPSSPAKLLTFSIVYAVCGVLSFFVIRGTLGVILGIVMIGIALLWFRGAATAQLRQQARRDEPD